MDWSAIDEAVAAGLPRAVTLLEALIAEPSTVGHEQGAQQIVARDLKDAGFDVSRRPIPADIADDPVAGIPQTSYMGRYDVVGTRGVGASPSLLLNGHVDVVPADEPARWASPPFEPRIRDGWLFGRGAGDMKAGFAAGLLALRALDDAWPGWLDGQLSFVSVIEEECTGNGTLAAARAGVIADAVLLPEPTDLQVLLGGVGIVWVGIDVDGRAGHAEAAQRSVNPIDAVARIVDALRDLERGINEPHDSGADVDPAFATVPHPYNVNIGTVQGGAWPSSVPAGARLGVRVGFPRAWTTDEALTRIRGAVHEACRDDDWFAAHPPAVRLTGFRAEGHALAADHPIVDALARAHHHAHGEDPDRVTMGTTTDARYYLNQFDRPALAYGPRARNIHGIDESVEVASIEQCARTLARFLGAWFHPRVLG